MFRVGESVGSYDIVAKLRAGGMATLFLGKKHGAAGFTRHVAIKVIHEHLASDPDFVRMFVDEALLQTRIQNPHVVHVEELGEQDGAHFLVMEYVHGAALAQLLLALGKRKRRPQIDIAVSIALQTLSGLHAAHELRGDDGRPLGVVHRDVSPQNVLLSRDGHVKLIDFGVAKAASASQQTQGAMIKGKVRYMPPEQAFGKGVDRRADIYALGIVLWEMLTMRKLFAAQDEIALLEMVRNPVIDPPSKWAPEVSPALDRVVLKALQKDPANRFATAQEMRRALTEAVPSAAIVEPSSIAELIHAAVGDELEKERRALPAAVSAQVAPAIDVTQIGVEEVLLTLTVSAAGLEAKSGMAPISASTAERMGGKNDPVLPPGATPAPAPVTSVPIGTPSQLASGSHPVPPAPLSGVWSAAPDGVIAPPVSLPTQRNVSTDPLPALDPPGRSRRPIAFAALALVVAAAAGGGVYAYRMRADGVVARPLPVRVDVAGPAPVVPPPAVAPTEIPSVPVAPPAPTDLTEGAGGAPVLAPSVGSGDTPIADGAATGAEATAVEPADETTRGTRPRIGRVRRPRETNDGESTGTGTSPFVTEF